MSIHEELTSDNRSQTNETFSDKTSVQINAFRNTSAAWPSDQNFTSDRFLLKSKGMPTTICLRLAHARGTVNTMTVKWPWSRDRDVEWRMSHHTGKQSPMTSSTDTASAWSCTRYGIRCLQFTGIFSCDLQWIHVPKKKDHTQLCIAQENYSQGLNLAIWLSGKNHDL